MLLKVYCLFENDYDSSILHAIKSTYKLADEEKNKLIEHERVLNKEYLKMSLHNNCMIPDSAIFRLSVPWYDSNWENFVPAITLHDSIVVRHIKHMHSVLSEYKSCYDHSKDDKLDIEEWEIDGDTWYDKHGWILRKEETK